MSIRKSACLRLFFLLVATYLAAGCSTAQYSAKTNMAQDFSGHINRVTVWSGIGAVPLLSQRHLLGMSDTFANFFADALKSDFSNSGVVADLHPFSSGTDKIDDLARFEEGFAPEFRLVIAVPEYHTIAAQGYKTNMADMKLDISLYTVKDNRRVWRSELLVDGGRIPGLTWRETGAQQLAHQLTDMLKRDKLI